MTDAFMFIYFKESAKHFKVTNLKNDIELRPKLLNEGWEHVETVDEKFTEILLNYGSDYIENYILQLKGIKGNDDRKRTTSSTN